MIKINRPGQIFMDLMVKSASAYNEAETYHLKGRNREKGVYLHIT